MLCYKVLRKKEHYIQAILYWLKQIKITTFPYVGGLSQVGSECGTWPESGWPADQVEDQVMMGLAFFFSPSRYLSLGYLVQSSD